MLLQIARSLAPPHCLVCNQEGQVVCQKCIASLIQPLAGESDLSGANRLIVASYYGVHMRSLIHALKFQRLREAAGVLAAICSPLLMTERKNLDVVTWVPPAGSRFRRRGYDHGKLIATALARILDLPARQHLSRLGYERQVGQTKQKRLEQAKNQYIARVRIPKSVLIVDDVITTGATLTACALALRKSGAEKVIAIAAARH